MPFGLDISDRSVELAALLKRKGRVALTHVARVELPPGVITQGVIVEPDRLVQALASLVSSAFGPKHGKLQAGISIPEVLTYSKTFSLPASLSPELATKAVALEAQDVFPVSVPNTVQALTPLSRQNETQDVFYAAVEKPNARAYRDAVLRAGIQPLFLDAESMALARALVESAEQELVLVADIGARTTMIMVVDRGGIRFSSNVASGGDALNAAIEHRLNVSLSQAEALRRKAGFDPGIDDGRLFLIMEHPMGEIIEDIRRTIAFYETRAGRGIRKIILAGGTSLTPGIREYVASNFSDIEVVTGDPLRDIDASLVPQSETLKRSGLVFSAAIGLALRAAGVRDKPGLNLMPDQRQHGRRLQGIFNRIGNAFASLTSMVTRKKPQPKKRTSKAAAEEPAVAAPAAPEPVRMQIEAPAAMPEPAAPAAPEPQPAPVEPPKKAAKAAPAPVPKTESADSALDVMGGLASIAPTPEPAYELPKPSPKPASSGSDDLDYGHGIGDILGSVEEIDASKPPESDDAVLGPDDAKAASRRSIESILSKTPAPRRGLLRRPPAPAFVNRPKLRIPWVLLLVVALFLTAAGGIFMFVKKNGVPKPPSFIVNLFTKKDAAPAAPSPAPAGAPGEAPATASVVVLLAADAKAAGDKPVVATRIIETDVSAKDTFPATGETSSAAGKSSGYAIIVNTTSKAYAFVATTRLLSKDGVLFRMKAGSPIPANGEVKVAVAADQAGPAGDIGPTTFTIPGLPPFLQKDIYAKSETAMTGGGGKGKGVSAEDIAAAKATLTEKLKKEAQDNFGVMVAEGEKLVADLITPSELSVNAPKAGTAGEKFTMTLNLRFRAMLVPEKAIGPLLEKAMTDALPAGLNPVDYALGAPLYIVQAYPTPEQAEVRIEAPIVKQ